MHSIDMLLGLAIEATKIAEKLLIEKQSSVKEIKNNHGHDIKIKGDRIAEESILAFLKKKSGYAILSEETGYTGKRNTELYWVVDPIDGSLNFSRNIPISCISIALWKEDTPVLGVVNDFNRNEIFTGIVGTGSWLNGEAIRVNNEDRMERSVVASGFPSHTDYSTEALLTVVDKVQKFKKIRLIGSASLSTVYVACGRFDAYMEKGIMFWDIAAGIAITVAAGGRYRIRKTGSKFQYDALISSSKLFEKTKSSI